MKDARVVPNYSLRLPLSPVTKPSLSHRPALSKISFRHYSRVKLNERIVLSQRTESGKWQPNDNAANSRWQLAGYESLLERFLQQPQSVTRSWSVTADPPSHVQPFGSFPRCLGGIWRLKRDPRMSTIFPQSPNRGSIRFLLAILNASGLNLNCPTTQQLILTS